MALSEFTILCPRCKIPVGYDRETKTCRCSSCKNEVDTTGYDILNLSMVVVAFSEDVQDYASFHRTIMNGSKQISDIWEDSFRTSTKTAEQCVIYISTFGKTILTQLIDMAIKYLANYGIYEYDTDAFWDYFFNRPYVNGVSYILNRQEELGNYLDELTGQVRSHEAALQEQNSSRGRWSGGGFGLSGALKGAAMAGALNMAEDFGSTILQSWKRQDFQDAIKRKIVSKCSSDETISRFCNSVVLDYRNIYWAVYDILKSHGVYKCKQYHLYDMDKSRRGVINNIKKGLVPAKDAVLAILTQINENPFCESVDMLDMLYDYTGAMNGDIMRLAEYVGYSGPLKSRILPKLNEKHRGLLEGCKTSADYHSAVEKISAIADETGVAPEELEIYQEAVSLEEKARKQEEALEKSRRTFKGVVYDTIEEKKAAEKHSYEINSAFEKLKRDIDSAKLLSNASAEKGELNIAGWLDNELFSEIKEWELPRYDQEIERFTSIAADPLFEGGVYEKRLISDYIEKLKKYKERAAKREAKGLPQIRSVRHLNAEEIKQDQQRVISASELFLKTDFTQSGSAKAFKEAIDREPPLNIGDYNAAADLLGGLSPAELKLLQNYTRLRAAGFVKKVILTMLAGFGIVIAIMIAMVLLRDIPKLFTMEQYNNAANTLGAIYFAASGLYLVVSIAYGVAAGGKWKTATVGGTLLHPMLQPKKRCIAPSLVIGTKEERKAAKIRIATEETQARIAKANAKKKPPV